MMSWIRRLWLWFKSLWSLGRRSGSGQEVKPEPTGLDYENGLLALLEAVDGGLTEGNIKAILMRRGIKPEGLARWLRLEGLSQAQNREELGLAAREVARGLTEVSQEEEVSVLIGDPPNQGSLSEVEKFYQLLKTIGASSNSPEQIFPMTSTVQNAEFWFNQGCEQYKRGDFLGAVASYENAIQFNPYNANIWFNRGVTLDDLGRKKEAVASYDRAIQFNPYNANTWFNRGRILDDLGRNEEAIASYDRAIQLNFNLVEPWNNRGNVLRDLGRKEEAIASYDRAIQLNPDFVEAWSNRGVVLSDLRRNEEAIASFDRAIQLNPNYFEAWENRGIATYNSYYYNPDTQRYFSDQFQREISTYRPFLLSSLENTDQNTFISTLVSTFPSEQAQSIAVTIQSNWHNSLENLKKSLKNPDSIASFVFFPPSHFLQPSHSLNQRGYEGAINSYEIGIQTLSSDEGKGKLHHAAGQAHYQQAQQSRYPSRYNQKATLSKAARSFENALNLLPAATYPEPHLEVIQSIIKLLLATDQPEAAEQQQLAGLEILLDLLNQQPTLAQKRRTEAKFNALRQLKIDILLQKGYPIKALRTAELEKNRVLTHILDGWQENIISPTYDQIQTLLTPNTAIIYWHLTPHSLIAFILKANQDPIIHRAPSAVSDLETWVKTWHSDYLDYRGKNKDKSQTKKSNHPWRLSLSDRLDKLGEILDIAALQPHLNGIDRLILIPHQTLHHFPLDRFFPCPNITTLPSLQIALTLQQKAQPHLAPKDYSLLSVQDPLHDLDFAEIESQIINRLFTTVTPIDANDADPETLKTQLQQNHQIFHFTGHGYHNFRQPEDSALLLKNRQPLTAQDISRLSLHSYQLICLAACETALNSPQNLDTDYVGLVSAFLKANASSVISTLWNTDEVSSAYLMINFYQRFLAEIPAAIALQQAKNWLSSVKYHQLAAWLETLKKNTPSTVNDLLEDAIAAIRQDPAKMESDEPPYAEPYYWATFTYSGLSHQ